MLTTKHDVFGYAKHENNKKKNSKKMFRGGEVTSKIHFDEIFFIFFNIFFYDRSWTQDARYGI